MTAECLQIFKTIPRCYSVWAHSAESDRGDKSWCEGREVKGTGMRCCLISGQGRRGAGGDLAERTRVDSAIG